MGEATDVKHDAGTIGPARSANAPAGSHAFSGHDRTHAHMIQADPAGRFVLHVDLGLDKIFVWKFDDQRGVLMANDPVAVRHAAARRRTTPFPFSPQRTLVVLHSGRGIDRRVV